MASEVKIKKKKRKMCNRRLDPIGLNQLQLLWQLTVVNCTVFLHTHNTDKAQTEGGD